MCDVSEIGTQVICHHHHRRTSERRRRWNGWAEASGEQWPQARIGRIQRHAATHSQNCVGRQLAGPVCWHLFCPCVSFRSGCICEAHRGVAQIRVTASDSSIGLPPVLPAAAQTCKSMTRYAASSLCLLPYDSRLGQLLRRRASVRLHARCCFLHAVRSVRFGHSARQSHSSPRRSTAPVLTAHTRFRTTPVSTDGAAEQQRGRGGSQAAQRLSRSNFARATRARRLPRLGTHSILCTFRVVPAASIDLLST